jgi:hypothetical protein
MCLNVHFTISHKYSVPYVHAFIEAQVCEPIPGVRGSYPKSSLANPWLNLGSVMMMKVALMRSIEFSRPTWASGD